MKNSCHFAIYGIYAAWWAHSGEPNFFIIVDPMFSFLKKKKRSDSNSCSKHFLFHDVSCYDCMASKNVASGYASLSAVFWNVNWCGRSGISKHIFFLNHLPIYCFFSVDLPFECTPNCLIRARINLHLSRCGYTFLLNEYIDHLSSDTGTAPKHLAVFFTYSQKRIMAFHWITAAICRSPHPPMLH